LQFLKLVSFFFLLFFFFFSKTAKTCFYHVILCLQISLENKNAKNRNMETTRSCLRKQVCLFRKIALKTHVEPISNLCAQCRMVPTICGSHPHIAIFLNLLHPTQRARIYSTHVSSAQNHSDKCIAMPLHSLYFFSSTPMAKPEI
jgi:hypothetical protein